MSMNKTVAIIFVLLMVGSTIGAMVVSILGDEDDGLQLPTQRIMGKRLTDYQRTELLRRGYTLIEYEYPQNCFACETQKMTLESFVHQSDNQIFLQEIQSSISETKISIVSVKGTENFVDPTDEEVKNALCEIILERPIWCIDL